MAVTVPTPRSRIQPRLRPIARLLAVDVEQLRDLHHLPDADLRTLHEQISESYFGAGRDTFARVAGLAKAMPAPLAAALAERFLPGHLGARIVEMLDPDHARTLVNRVSIGYLADLAVALDPVRARAVVRVISPARAGEVAAELYRRADYLAIAELASAVTTEALAAALARARALDLIQVAGIAVWDRRMTALVAGAANPQIDEILLAMADAALWAEGSVLIEHLDEADRTQLTARLAASPLVVFQAFETAAQDGGLSAAAVAVVGRARSARTRAGRDTCAAVRARRASDS